MSFEIVHVAPPARVEAPPPPQAAPVPAKTPTPVPSTITRSVSAKATVVIPEAADHWGKVTAALPAFCIETGRMVSHTSIRSRNGLLAGAATCLPWLGAFVALCTGVGVGVAACLGWAGAQHSLRLPKERHDPVTAAHIAKLREAYEAAQALAADDPLKQAAQRHAVVNNLSYALAYRGLCIEGELFLQDLKHHASPNDPIDAAGKRSADAATALARQGYRATFDEVEPYEAVALNLHYKGPESDPYGVVHRLADQARGKIDQAVGVEVQRLLDRELEGTREG